LDSREQYDTLTGDGAASG